MAFDDSGDEAQRDAVFLIDSGDTEADRIQSAGHVDGTIELSLGIDAHLKADEEHAVFHAGNDTEIVGVGSDLLQGCPIGILRCLFDGEVDRIDIPLLVVRNMVKGRLQIQKKPGWSSSQAHAGSLYGSSAFYSPDAGSSHSAWLA